MDNGYDFIHIPKTGGTSLVRALGVQHAHYPARARHPSQSARPMWTTVRNPWDHAVSWFLHQKLCRNTLMSVSGWARAGFPSSRWADIHPLDQLDWLTDKDGDMLVRVVFTFEQGVPAIYEAVCALVGVEKPQPLSHANKRTTVHPELWGLRSLPSWPARPHYSLFYDDEAVDIVARSQAALIERFGYEFDDRR